MKSPARKSISGSKSSASKKPKASAASAASLAAFGTTPDEMLKQFNLLKASTSLELKLNVFQKDRRAVVDGIGFDPVEAEPRQVYFFDTPDLDLNSAGVVVRARRSPGGKGDTVVKLRPFDPTLLDNDLRRSPGFKIEVDGMPGGYVCSASLKGVCSAQEVLDVRDGKAPIESIFTPEQRAFYKAHAPADLKMNALVALGPTFQLRVKHQPKNFDRRVTVEFWLYPDGSHLYEVSTKGTPAEAFQVIAQFKAFIAGCGIPVDGQGRSKTSSALSFFSNQLKKQTTVGETEPAL